MPEKKQDLCRYIIINSEAYTEESTTGTSFQPSRSMIAIAPRPQAVTPAPQMRVIDSIHDDGPKLVEMSAEAELSLRLSHPGLKIVPEVIYHRQWERFNVHQRSAPAKSKAKAAKGVKKAAGQVVKASTQAAVTSTGFTVTVTSTSSAQPLVGAKVVAFTNFAARVGDEGETDASGRVKLRLSPSDKLERVYIYGPPGSWGFFAADITGSQIAQVKLTDINVKDSNLLLTQLYGSLPENAGDGITVAIIDSGIDATHPDLQNVTGGLNCVGVEVRANPAAAANWRPALTEGEHGTHVAGIIGGRGTASGFRGISPGVKMRSYRVFPDVPDSNGKLGANNFDIVKAIDTAIADKCDVINMSLGGPVQDDATNLAIDRALAAGIVVVVAAGNADRQPVYFPAAYPPCVAVSAMGRVGSFPKTSIGTGNVSPPKGSPPATEDFMADFSNIGPEIDITGPGVEIVSTLPGTSHGPMNGTSMACPAVSGFVAYLLAVDPSLKLNVGAGRSRAVKDALYASCKPKGFGRNFEGFGLPLVPQQIG